MEQNYYLGMDIGTNSCGWALTTDKYELAKINGRDAWGVRLFQEADTKAERRLKRTARRRMVRKRLQNSWLKELFLEEVNKVDDNFFDRLQYSNLWKEDKLRMNPELTSKYSLFNDVLKSVYTDKEYYKDYKTVYHLRKQLLQQPADDIRLLFLAVHSILTHRGHFLNGSSYANDEETQDVSPLVQELFLKLADISAENEAGNSFGLKCENTEFVDRLLNNFCELTSIKAIKEKLIEDLGAKTKIEKEIASILVSGKSSTDKIFSEIEKEDKIEFDFDSDKFEDEIYGKLVLALSDDELAVIDLLKAVFTNIQLKKVLGKNNYICQAMVEKYEKHNEQLKEFKAFVRKYYPSKMSLFFRKYSEGNDAKDKAKIVEFKNVDNYAKYVNNDLVDGKKKYFENTSSQESFYKFIKKQFEVLTVEGQYDSETFANEKQYFISLMDKNEFLPKIRARENAVIPNGLYVKELKQILKVSSEKYPFLNKKDEDDLTIADKIVSIVEFKVPYFVGPIGKNGDGKRVNGWAEKQSDLQLRPWTLSKIVDFDKAEDAFIQRMTNKCSYLPEEDVLPKDSLLYSKFRVLNELNNLKINGNNISVDLKQKLFNCLFEKYKKVSAKKVREFLVAENLIEKEDINNIVFSGIDKDFVNNYGSYVTLKDFFGEKIVKEYEEDFEKIIKYHTIFSDKSRLEKRICREFSYFKNEEVKFLKSLNYSKWGRLSKKFLTGIMFEDKITGEVTNVIDAMWNTNYNLMELMGKDYTLSEKLTERAYDLQKDLTYDDIESMHCSPAVKRGAWQAIQIINEIKKKIGKYPDKIFVEVTRNDETKGDNGRKDSRHNSLLKSYNNKELKADCKKYAIKYDKLLEELNKKDNSNIRSDRLFLYFLQLGKCMYTGETIDIVDLYNENKYDIDHIIPQSKLKDDSLNNKVLVKKDANRAKGDCYPIFEICPQWIEKQKGFWQMLKDRNLISQEKLSRLLRIDPFTDADANDFVNRQMVITNQETTAVINLLKSVIDNPNNIVFSKAKFVSDFRKIYGIYKSRNVNNFHHAKDAYLNIVVGDVLRTRFTENFWKREDDDKNKGITANISKLFNFTVWNNKTGEPVWNGLNDVFKIRNVCDRNTCLVSIMPYSNENGMFYDETIYRSEKKQRDGDCKKYETKASIKLKGNKDCPLASIEKYGGYNSMKGAYFIVVESLDKKGKVQKTIETVPILLNYTYRNSQDKQQKIIEYLEKENDVKITRVILDKLKYNSLLRIDGGLYKITGKTGNSYKILKANEWHIENAWVEYIKNIEKYFGYSEDFRKELPQTEDLIIISKADKPNKKERILSREKNIELYNVIIKQLSKSIYNISGIQGVVEKLKQGFECFEILTINDQAKMLNGLIAYVGGAYTVDLTAIGGVKEAGVTTISKNITDLNISLVCQSVSGIEQRRIKL